MSMLLRDRERVERVLENVRIFAEKRMTERFRYYDYMKSHKWKMLRKSIIKRCKNRCEGCGTVGIDNVHHLTYKRFGHERPEDLIALCRTCHEEIHKAHE